MTQQKIIKNVTTKDRGERWCSHHQKFASSKGGRERIVSDGMKSRWICQRCADALDARKSKLTKGGEVITNCEQNLVDCEK